MKLSTAAGLLPRTKKKSSSTSVLTQWLTEVASFHRHYHYLEQHIGQQLGNMSQPDRCTVQSGSQCSLGSLVLLQTEMRSQLERMIVDMDEPCQDLARVKEHTLQLSRLNQQARTQLMLSKNSAS